MSNQEQNIVLKDNTVFIKSYENSSKILKHNSILRELIGSCSNTSCPIKCNTWARCIPNGKLNTEIMFADAYPNAFDVYGGCFTGITGEILHQGLSNINRDNIYCTTILKCNNIQDVNQNVIKCCLSFYFLKELENIKPKKLILTNAAYLACVKYNVLHSVDNITLFTKNIVNIIGLDYELELYVVLDFDESNEQNQKNLIQGLQFIS